MESCSEVIFHHLDLPVKSVRLLARATSACDDGIVSADVYTSMNVYSIGGWLIKKNKIKGTIDVVLSIWGVYNFTHSYFISNSLKWDENALRFFNLSQSPNPNSTC